MVRYVMLVLDDNVYRVLESVARKYRSDVSEVVRALVYYYVEKGLKRVNVGVVNEVSVNEVT